VADVQIGEIYEFEDGSLYTVMSKSEITDFRDGQPFTYPAIILEDVHNKSRVVPEFQLDRLSKYTPTHTLESDEYEVFVKCFELATQGKYTKEINSYKSDSYREYNNSLQKIVENFNHSFSGNSLSNKSKELLKTFAMMLLVTVEMNSVKKKESTT